MKDADSDSPGDDTDGEEREERQMTFRADLPKICPNCITANSEGSHMCRACFTPLSSHAAIDPLLSISARGDTFWKASSNPKKPIIMTGICILFGPAFLFFGTLFMSTLLNGLDSSAACVGLPMYGLFAFISGGILFKTVGNFFREDSADARGFPVVEDKGGGEEEELAKEAEAAREDGAD